MLMDKYMDKNRQRNGWNNTNFDTISLSSLNSIRQSVFELESGNGNVDGQTNEQAELHQFRKQLRYDGDLSHFQD